APVTTKDANLVAASDPIILNELEAADITGLPRETPTEELFAALKDLARTCVVTLGPAGAAVIDEDGVTRVPAPQMENIVDTTGAGDAFCGTLAAEVATGSSLVEATRVAVAAGSLATQKASAAASYAAEQDVRALAAEQDKRSERPKAWPWARITTTRMISTSGNRICSKRSRISSMPGRV